MKNIENLRTSLKGKIAIIKGKCSDLIKILSKCRFSCVHFFKNRRFVTTRLLGRPKKSKRRPKKSKWQPEKSKWQPEKSKWQPETAAGAGK